MLELYTTATVYIYHANNGHDKEHTHTHTHLEQEGQQRNIECIRVKDATHDDVGPVGNSATQLPNGTCNLYTGHREENHM